MAWCGRGERIRMRGKSGKRWLVIGASSPRNSFVLILLLLALQGCGDIVAGMLPSHMRMHHAADPGFHQEYTEQKRLVQQNLISAEAAGKACLVSLNRVHSGHFTPPPYPNEICKIGSFANRRYELTKQVVRGVISPETWEQECLALPDRPETGTPCYFDPLGDMLAIWHQMVQQGVATEEAVRQECLDWGRFELDWGRFELDWSRCQTPYLQPTERFPSKEVRPETSRSVGQVKRFFHEKLSNRSRTRLWRSRGESRSS